MHSYLEGILKYLNFISYHRCFVYFSHRKQRVTTRVLHHIRAISVPLFQRLLRCHLLKGQLLRGYPHQIHLLLQLSSTRKRFPSQQLIMETSLMRK